MKQFTHTIVFGLFVLVCPQLSQAQQPSPQKCVIGVIAPLSGPLAEYGMAARNGIELAREQNKDRFANIEFLYEDSQWVPKTAVSAFNKLRSVDKVSLILNWGNPTSEAVAPLAERYRVPLIAMTLDPSIAIGKKFVVRSTNSARMFSERLAAHLKHAGYKKMGVVLSQNTYVQGLYDGLLKSIGPQQTLEVIDTFTSETHDFRTSIAKIRKGEYDAIGVFLISGQVSEFYRQLKNQRIAVPTFGTDFFESETEITFAAGGMEGAVYTHLGTTDAFRKDYEGRYGNNLQIAYAGNWYDMAMVLTTLCENNSMSGTPEEVMAALRGVGPIAGVGGTFEYRQTEKDGGYFHFPIYAKQITGPRSVILAKDQ